MNCFQIVSSCKCWALVLNLACSLLSVCDSVPLPELYNIHSEIEYGSHRGPQSDGPSYASTSLPALTAPNRFGTSSNNMARHEERTYPSHQVDQISTPIWRDREGVIKNYGQEYNHVENVVPIDSHLRKTSPVALSAKRTPTGGQPGPAKEKVCMSTGCSIA